VVRKEVPGLPLQAEREGVPGLVAQPLGERPGLLGQREPPRVVFDGEGVDERVEGVHAGLGLVAFEGGHARLEGSDGVRGGLRGGGGEGGRDQRVGFHAGAAGGGP
jgi:hypothetical protein